MSVRWPVTKPCDSCDEPVIWAYTEAGKRMPIDVEPSESGNLSLSNHGVVLRVKVVPKPARYPGQKLHTSHFATCEYAAEHRKPRRTAPPPAMPQDGLFTPPSRLEDDAATDAYHDQLADCFGMESAEGSST